MDHPINTNFIMIRVLIDSSNKIMDNFIGIIIVRIIINQFNIKHSTIIAVNFTYILKGILGNYKGL